MSTPPPVPPAAAPPRPVGASFFDWIRSLGVTRPDGAWVAGVCAGIAARTGLDPMLVRGIAVVIAVLGGPVFLAYAVGWALLPDARGHIHAESAVNGRFTYPMIFIGIAAILTFVPFMRGIWFDDVPLLWGMPDWLEVTLRTLWVIALAAGVVWLIVMIARHVPGRPGSSDAAGSPSAATSAPGAAGAAWASNAPGAAGAPSAAWASGTTGTPTAASEATGAAAGAGAGAVGTDWEPATATTPNPTMAPVTDPASAAPTGASAFTGTTTAPPLPPQTGWQQTGWQQTGWAQTGPAQPGPAQPGAAPTNSNQSTWNHGGWNREQYERQREQAREQARARTEAWKAAHPRPQGAGAAFSSVVLGIALVAAAVVGIGYGAVVPDGKLVLVVSIAALVVVAVGIVVAGIRGRTSGGLSPFAWLLAIVVVITGVLPAGTAILPFGTQTVNVSQALADGPESYLVLAGRTTVDADDLTARSGGGTVDVWLGAGQTEVLVPDGVALRVESHILAGSVTLGSSRGGIFVEDDQVFTTSGGVARPSALDLTDAQLARIPVVRVWLLAGNVKIVPETER